MPTGALTDGVEVASAHRVAMFITKVNRPAERQEGLWYLDFHLLIFDKPLGTNDTGMLLWEQTPETCLAEGQALLGQGG